MESKIFIVIIIICLVLLAIGLIKRRMDLLVNFGLRVFAGLVGIYIVNMLLDGLGLSLGVGTNGLTALTIGGLGIPGFLLVYGVAIYYYFV
ncbi:pro-sigmaK processing inhibitor BofA family protein [Anaerocolumna sp.]|uniref:pro-sigmaK processing inhibitor BofA family protein n=1 Tax=Anaerocolumna sp. TaxID=2041569 RepID=UPI0028AE3C19|nr:pro-sigmaK processing inhibitor BofA family protein [Anaerocolumna sp.]